MRLQFPLLGLSPSANYLNFTRISTLAAPLVDLAFPGSPWIVLDLLFDALQRITARCFPNSFRDNNRRTIRQLQLVLVFSTDHTIIRYWSQQCG